MVLWKKKKKKRNVCWALQDPKRGTPYQKAKWFPKQFSFEDYQKGHFKSYILPFPQKTSPAAWPELQIHVFNFRPYLLVKYKCLRKGHTFNIISHFTFVWMHFFLFSLTLSGSIKDLKLLPGNELRSDFMKAQRGQGRTQKGGFHQ